MLTFEEAIEASKEHLERYLMDAYGIKNTRKNFRCILGTHPDKNPSMHFNPKNNTVHCFSCQQTADLGNLFELNTGLEKHALWTEIFEYCGLEVEGFTVKSSPDKKEKFWISSKEARMLGLKLPEKNSSWKMFFSEEDFCQEILKLYEQRKEIWQKELSTAEENAFIELVKLKNEYPFHDIQYLREIAYREATNLQKQEDIRIRLVNRAKKILEQNQIAKQQQIG